MQTGFDQFEKNQGGWKDVAMGDIAMASLLFSFKKLRGLYTGEIKGTGANLGVLSAKQPKFAC